MPELFVNTNVAARPSPALFDIQKRYRCMIGCGSGFQSIEILTKVVRQTKNLVWDKETEEGVSLSDVLSVIDGDLVQAITAVKSELMDSSGVRKMFSSEMQVINLLRAAILCGNSSLDIKVGGFAFERGLSCLEKLLESSGLER